MEVDSIDIDREYDKWVKAHPDFSCSREEYTAIFRKAMLVIEIDIPPPLFYNSENEHKKP